MAVAALVLAGCSSGRVVGGCISSGEMFAVLSWRFASDHACCLPHSAKQIGLRCVTFLFPRGSESPVVRSHVLVRLSRFAGSIWDCAFFAGDSDGERGTKAAIRKKAPRWVGASLAMNCVFDMIPPGVRWGCAPQTAPRRPVSLDSLHVIRGHVRFTL